jgi:hypothetical protein
VQYLSQWVRTVAMAGALSIGCVAGHAKMSDAVKIQGPCVTGKTCLASTEKDEADLRAVNALITEYRACRRRAADIASSPAQKDALRKACVKEYNPKFAKACVGAARSVGICTRYRTRGTIEGR